MDYACVEQPVVHVADSLFDELGHRFLCLELLFNLEDAQLVVFEHVVVFLELTRSTEHGAVVAFESDDRIQLELELVTLLLQLLDLLFLLLELLA